MSNNGDSPVVNRRDVLRSGAVVGGGILASVIPGGSAAASDHGQAGAVGYLSRSSYRKLVGTDDVDCVPNVDGWGDTFYVERAAEDSGGETGVSVAVPDAGGGSNARYQAYTITADETVELAGGPSGHGPWQQPCGSWLFVDSDHSLETGSVYRVTEAQGPGLPESCQEGIRATDSDGEPIGAPMEIMRVTYEPVPPAEQWRQVEMLANGGEDAGFGTAIAIDGTTAVVGASGEGAAYVYTLTDDGWTQQAKLGETVEITGREIAISDETILVDAPGAGVGDNDSVRVFTRSDGRWQQQATLDPEDPDSAAAFASSLDIDGDTAVVGAPDADGTSEAEA